jgi:nitroreductase
MMDAIKQRKTQKVLANNPWTPSLTEGEREELVQELLTLAAAAPYHYESAAKYRTDLTSGLPFRCYVADASRCRAAVEFATAEEVQAGKIGHMLNAAEVLLLVTWLPDTFGEPVEGREPIPFTGNLRNMEHLAATGAAIQNMLVGATALGYPNYWSSGGVLRFDPMRTHFNVPTEEIILGTLFVFPKDAESRADEVVPGKLRDKGKALDSWSKKV